MADASPSSAPSSGDSAEVAWRVRQQGLLARLGVEALQGTPWEELIARAAVYAAEGLRAEYSKVLEFRQATNDFLIRAGVGWRAGTIGHATISADLGSQAGFALKTGLPVISNDLDGEVRFQPPALLREHGIRRAINVILQGDQSPFGVLEVDSSREGAFVPDDVAFLQGAANVLGMAIQRQRVERDLEATLDRYELLLKEANHRIKNSLQLVASMLSLQSTATDDGAVRAMLHDALSRVSAVGRVHERLYRSDSIGIVDLGQCLSDVARALDGIDGKCRIVVDAPSGIALAADKAIPLALIANELISNAVKHGGGERRISVRLVRSGANKVELSVRDSGDGLPAGFDINGTQGTRHLGMQIVQALARQLQADLAVRSDDNGSEFSVAMPV